MPIKIEPSKVGEPREMIKAAILAVLLSAGVVILRGWTWEFTVPLCLGIACVIAQLWARRAIRKLKVHREREESRRSFAYGNVKLHNESITRELVDDVADRMISERLGKEDGGGIGMSDERYYYVTLDIIKASGWQTARVKASSPEEAFEKYKNGAFAFFDEEVEVTSLSDPEGPEDFTEEP